MGGVPHRLEMPPHLIDTMDVRPTIEKLPSPKRSPRTPPKRRPKDEREFVELLEKVQGEVVEYAKLEVQKQKEAVKEKMGGGALWETKAKTTYKAPDGTTFETEGKYKQYMYATYYSFKHREGETLVKKPGDIRGQAFDLCDLKNCDVQLLDHIGQVFVDDLVDCKVYIGACGADVFVRRCTNCTFTIACKQLRLRDCSHDVIYLYSATRPALESSHHMKFAPFNGAYPRQKSHFKQAGLDPEHNQWDQIHDFSKSVEAFPSHTGPSCLNPSGTSGRSN